MTAGWFDMHPEQRKLMEGIQRKKYAVIPAGRRSPSHMQLRYYLDWVLKHDRKENRTPSSPSRPEES